MLTWREKDVCEKERREMREQNGIEWKTKKKKKNGRRGKWDGKRVQREY